MTHSKRHRIRALCLLPAVLALFIMLFAMIPAETSKNWLRIRAPQSPTLVSLQSASPPASDQQCFAEEEPFWITRYALASPEPQDAAQLRCTGENCFDAAGFDLVNMEPSAGGVAPSPVVGEAKTEAAASDQFDLDLAAEPPAAPSSEPVLVAALDTFTNDTGVRQAPGGNGAGSGDGSAENGDGTAGGEPTPSGNSEPPSTEYVLLPGSDISTTSGSGSGGGGTTGGTTGTGGTTPDGSQPGGGGGGPGFFLLGSGGGSGSGSGSGSGTGTGGTSDPAPFVSLGAGPVVVSSPAAASLLATALATLALRRRVGHD